MHNGHLILACIFAWVFAIWFFFQYVGCSNYLIMWYQITECVVTTNQTPFFK